MNKALLIVDDDQRVLKSLDRELHREGYEIFLAGSGEEGLQLLKQHDIAVVLSDLRMPHMDGVTFLEEVRQFKPEVVRLVLTGHGSKENAIEAINRSGVFSYIAKPWSPAELKTVITKAFQHYHLAAENRRLLALTQSQNRELKNLNADLKKSNQELAELNQLKNKFVGIAAHDLRNPLNTISGFSEILLYLDIGPLNKEQHEFLTNIHNTAKETTALVNDLLDVSVIESGKLVLNLQTGAITKLIEDRIAISRLIAEKKGLKIHTQFQETPEVRFDPRRINQVFDNLFTNAVKYSPEGANIYIEITAEENRVKVSVRDEGAGISEAEQTRLFGAFQKLSTQPTGGERSTGLGLAIVKKIVTAHGGTVAVDSRPGSGSTFSVLFPAAL